MSFFEQHEKNLAISLWLILLVDMAKKNHIAPDKILKGSKLFLSDLSNPTLVVSHQQFSQVIHNINKCLPHGNSAFLLGSRLYPSHLESAGQAIFHAQNLSDIIVTIRHFHHQVFPFLFMRSESSEQHQYCLFNQAISRENLHHYQFICELFTSLLISIAKQKQLPLSRLSIRFPYPAPRHIEQYHSYLPCQFEFSPSSKNFTGIAIQQSNNLPLQIKFDKGLLSYPLAHGNPTLIAHYQQKVPSTTANIGFIQYVMQKMVERLQKKQEINAQWLAEQLTMSQATLKRKLSQHNVTYQQLFDMVRQQQAVFLLTEQHFNNEKIARDLNFSDITNFRRSFKRWTGLTPQALKKVF
ncbi:helix-turn-helix domain-containing protein [Colwelliaceae bacterium MEBiC 14330]